MINTTVHFNLKRLDEYFNRSEDIDYCLGLMNDEELTRGLDNARHLIFDSILLSDERVESFMDGDPDISAINLTLAAIFMSKDEVMYLFCKFLIDLSKPNQIVRYRVYDDTESETIERNMIRLGNYLLNNYTVPDHFEYKEDFENCIEYLKQQL